MTTSFKSFLLFIVIACLQLTSFAQVQIGGDIDGELLGERSGNSISMPDKYTVAIGSPNNDGNGTNSGHVRIFRWNDSSWVQKGANIEGDTSGDQLGYSVIMPDSNTIAIGAPYNDGNGNNSGHVRIYRWNGSSWIQKGSDINGGNAGDISGFDVSMPDSNTVAIGAVGAKKGNEIYPVGHVRVFHWNGSTWLQRGNDIYGEAFFDASGYSVSMPDTNTVAIGAPHNEDNGSNSGHARIYKWNGNAWEQKGADINGVATEDVSAWSDINGVATEDVSAWSVSMPDSNTVAIGAPFYGTSGHVRIFQWSGNSWLQKGNDIESKDTADQLGWSVDMINSNTIAIGAIGGENNMVESVGRVIVYNWNNNGWVQKEKSINGVANGDAFGMSVSMADTNTFAIGAPFNDNNGSNSGHVKIYSFCNSKSTIDPLVCDFFTSPSGNITWTTNGTYQDTIPNAAGCDSIITINLTVNRNTLDTISPIVCDNYISPSRNYNWTVSGTYQDTVPNSIGCDSLITIDLKVNNGSAISVFPTVCSTYTSPSGKIWTTSGQYKDTLVNVVGCDSIITINLTIDTINTLATVSNDSLIATDTNATFQWLDCGNNYSAIPGATSRVFEPTLSGNYAVSLDKLSCRDTSACYSIVITGLQASKSQEETITIYPNPSDGLFTIDFPFTNENKVYTVIDINGKVVREGVINKEKTQLDFSEFISGIYLLRIEDSIVKLVLN